MALGETGTGMWMDESVQCQQEVWRDQKYIKNENEKYFFVVGRNILFI